MLSKFALIVGYPGEKGEENYCEGVYTDVENYENYLKTLHHLLCGMQGMLKLMITI